MRYGSVFVAACVAASLTMLAPAPAGAAGEGPRCDGSQPRGTSENYDGGSVSALYDRLFHPADPEVPYLDRYVPQSLLPWKDWDGSGQDLMLVGMYRSGAPSYVVGLDSRTGEPVGTVQVRPSHLGGMGFLGPWLLTGDNPWPEPGSPTVLRYRVDGLRSAMAASVAEDRPTPLDPVGPAQPIEATDFIAVDGDSVYTGNHGSGGVPGLMYRYRMAADGQLRRLEGPWRIPLRAQGMVITAHDFVFSSDQGPGGRGELNVVRRGSPERSADPIACVWVPSMPEDVAVQDGRLVLLFESGAQRYQHDHPVNRITHLHFGTLDSVLAATDPDAGDTSGRDDSDPEEP